MAIFRATNAEESTLSVTLFQQLHPKEYRQPTLKAEYVAILFSKNVDLFCRLNMMNLIAIRIQRAHTLNFVLDTE